MGTITEQAWEAFHTPLHQFIRCRVADEDTAEDLLQEVFLKIHQQGESLRDARRLESWIYQITRNIIIDHYRSRHQPIASLEAQEVLDLPEELPDDDIVSELLPCVRATVLALPEQDRQALILTEYQCLTQKELGERLGLSFSGAKSRVQRAREKLKQELLPVATLNWIVAGISWTISRAVTVVSSRPVVTTRMKARANHCVLFCQPPSLQVKANERGAAPFS